MTFDLEPDARTFLKEHKWGVLATGRRDGSPQQSMVGYAISTDDRIVISAKAYTAKWHNASRQPRVSLTISDGRVHLVIYGQAETISTDPGRAELTALVLAALSGNPAPDPDSIIDVLDQERRTVLRITPDHTIFHE